MGWPQSPVERVGLTACGVGFSLMDSGYPRVWQKVLIGTSWDLLTIYNWAYSPTCNPGNLAYKGCPKYT